MNDLEFTPVSYPCQGKLCFNKSTERQKGFQDKTGIDLVADTPY